MTIEITQQIRVQENSGYWYTVEDIHQDTGYDGCTISYMVEDSERGDKQEQYICMGKEEALAVAYAINKMFGELK